MQLAEVVVVVFGIILGIYLYNKSVLEQIINECEKLDDLAHVKDCRTVVPHEYRELLYTIRHNGKMSFVHRVLRPYSDAMRCAPRTAKCKYYTSMS